MKKYTWFGILLCHTSSLLGEVVQDRNIVPVKIRCDRAPMKGQESTNISTGADSLVPIIDRENHKEAFFHTQFDEGLSGVFIAVPPIESNSLLINKNAPIRPHMSTKLTAFTNFQLECNSPSYATSLYGGAGAGVDRIGFGCSDGSDAGSAGGDGGGDYYAYCSSGFNKITLVLGGFCGAGQMIAICNDGSTHTFGTNSDCFVGTYTVYGKCDPGNALRGITGTYGANGSYSVIQELNSRFCQMTTMHPTSRPTAFPSLIPTGSPTSLLTSLPTVRPRVHPTAIPSLIPSECPTSLPTSLPTVRPTVHPTAFPSLNPTGSPTSHPSMSPTNHPTAIPTTLPSESPSSHPTVRPTNQITAIPTTLPSGSPTNLPTSLPTVIPTVYPTAFPSLYPTGTPTSHPSTSPTNHPTAIPTTIPSESPSSHPTVHPTNHPTAIPTHYPSARPSSSPSRRPTAYPTFHPSSSPSLLPSTQPSLYPSFRPSTAPSLTPSCAPSARPSTTAAPTKEPGPQVINATMQDNGAGVFIIFDQPTDKGNLTKNEWNCGILFDFTSVSNSTCSWYTESIINATFSYGAYLDAGGKISLLTNISLRKKCLPDVDPFICASYEPSKGGVFYLAGPLDPVVPTVRLMAPSAVGPCDNITFDATGSHGDAGRPWAQIEWRVHGSLHGRLRDVELYLQRDSANGLSRPISIPSLSLLVDEITFSIILTNAFNKTSTGQTIVFVTNNNDTPLLSIIGPPVIHMRPYMPLSLRAISSYSSCSNSSSISYTWIVTSSQDKNLDLNIPGRLSLSLPPYTLSERSGRNFTVQLIALTSSSSRVNTSVVVSLQKGSVRAIIAGPAYRDTHVDMPIRIDASPSFDEEFQFSARPLSFSWSCFTETFPCTFPWEPIEDKVSIRPNVIPIATKATFFVNVSSTQDNRNSSTSITIFTIPSLVPLITLADSSFLVNPGVPLRVDASIFCNLSVTATWNVSQAVVPFAIRDVSLTPLEKVFSISESFQNTYFSLVLDTSNLIRGNTYTLTLFAISSLQTSSTANVDVYIRKSPTSGALDAIPPTGDALNTIFIITAYGWSTTSDAYPLSFEFFYYIRDPSNLLSLQTKINIAFIKSQLPAGDATANNTITLVVNVLDVFDAASVSKTSVQVSQSRLDDSHLLSRLHTRVTEHFSISDAYSVVQELNLIGSAFEAWRCLYAPDCKALNRVSCVEAGVTNTCGSCVSGFYASYWSSSSSCVESPVPDSLYNCPEFNGFKCSGRGECLLLDKYGNVVRECSNEGCTASCSCNDGFGGEDCSINTTNRISAVNEICTSIVNTSLSVDLSIDIVYSLIGAMEQSFLLDDLKSERIVDVCLNAFKMLALQFQLNVKYIASRGDTSILLFYRMLSKFLKGTSRQTNSRESSIISSYYTDVSDQLTDAAADVLTGLLSTMAPGQFSKSLNAEGVYASARNMLISDTKNASLSVTLLSGLVANIHLDEHGLQSCQDSTGYSSFAITQTDVNPSQSPILGWYNPQPHSSFSKTTFGSSGGSFILELPFFQEQSLSSKSKSKFYNRTLPVCAFRADNIQQECPCKVASFNNFTVSFLCFSTESLCSGVDLSISKRTSSDSPIVIKKEYFTVVKSIGAEILSVINRRRPISWKDPSVLVTFAIVLFLLLFLFSGLIYFSRWDDIERKIFLYSLRQPKDTFDESVHESSTFRQRLDTMFTRGLDINADENPSSGWFSSLRINILRENKVLSLVKHALLKFHPFICYFTSSSLTKPRVLKFISFFKCFLLSLFTSTLIYGVYYPADNPCLIEVSELKCLEHQSILLRGESMCAWESNLDNGIETCFLKPPPNDIGFVVLVAVILSLIVFPFDVILSYLLLSICSRKPQWSLSTFQSDHICRNSMQQEIATISRVLGHLNGHVVSMQNNNMSKAQYFEFSKLLSTLCIHYSQSGDAMLTLYGKILYSNSIDSLSSHVKKAMSRGRRIVDEVISVSDKVKNSNQVKEALLLHSFAHERLGSVERIILEPHLDQISNKSPSPVHPLLWLIAWIIVIGVNMLFIYWILQWGLSNSQMSFAGAMTNFAIEIVWGGLVTTTVRVVLVHVAIMAFARMKLTIAVESICDVTDEIDDYSETSDVAYWQLLSSTCYAAKILSKVDPSLHLPHALLKMSDNDVMKLGEDMRPKWNYC